MIFETASELEYRAKSIEAATSSHALTDMWGDTIERVYLGITPKDLFESDESMRGQYFDESTHSYDCVDEARHNSIVGANRHNWYYRYSGAEQERRKVRHAVVGAINHVIGRPFSEFAEQAFAESVANGLQPPPLKFDNLGIQDE